LHPRPPELIERSFAHCYETGAMRRVYLRGRENVLKRQLIHVGAFNLSLIFRQTMGAGTPRELRNRRSQLLIVVFWLTSGAEPNLPASRSILRVSERRTGVRRPYRFPNCRPRGGMPRAVRSCERTGWAAELTDESVWPTLLSKEFHPCGAGAFACQSLPFRPGLPCSGHPRRTSCRNGWRAIPSAVAASS